MQTPHQKKMLKKKLGKRIRALRQEREISLPKLNFPCWKHWQRIESGQDICFTTLKNVAIALDMEMSEIIKEL